MTKRPPNMIVRKWMTAKGVEKVAYYHRSSRASGRKMTPLGTNYKEALKLWADVEGQQLAPSKSGTVGAIYEQYMKWARNKKLSDLSDRTISDREAYWGKADGKVKKLNFAFAKIQIDDLKPEWMLQYFEVRTSQISAKKELKFLSVMCNWAKARGLMKAPNPTTDIMRLMKVDEKRDIYVEDAWMELVIKHGNRLVRDTLRFTYLCANRPDESAKARFTDIDGDELVIRLTKTENKGNAEKRIPIDGRLKAFIEEQKRRTVRSLYLVSDERGQKVSITGSFRRAFDKARDKAETEAAENRISFVRFQLKDIRAKAGTDICREYGIEAARLALGHTTQKQTNDYIRSVKGAAAKARNMKSGESGV